MTMLLVDCGVIETRSRQFLRRRGIDDLGVFFEESKNHGGNRPGDATDDFHSPARALEARVITAFLLNQSVIEAFPRLYLNGVHAQEVHFLLQQARARSSLTVPIKGGA